ncbi:thiamine pyrophosphate-requiring protein [Georgenia sp. Z1491]|uniref:thiamine pyrophosphate-requiring protein n=1 Tax=Georgenia sp. Z1491 TaxID=3416707 RepID=UPI003CF7A581
MTVEATQVEARPREDEILEACNGAEALLRLMAAQGVDWIFVNPGTDTAPVQEAAVALRERGIPAPRIQLCPDERVALAAAQGYWLRTGRPQVVLVHVDVGTQSLGAMLHNAQRGNSGVVIMAGTSPRTLEGELPGGRSIPVHWQQDQIDQAGIVRGYVKWADELTMPEVLPSLVPRAFQVARSEPAGPVYMTVAREVLMAPIESVRVVPPERLRAPVPPAACGDAIATTARWLAEAERPVIVTGRLGRRTGAAEAVARLVSLTGTPLIDAREYVNLPSSDDHYVEDDETSTELLRSADLVLLVDVEVPWVPTIRQPPQDARVVQIDLDPVKASMVSYGFRVDLPIQADSSRALWQLLEAVDEVAADDSRVCWRERGEALTAMKRDRVARRAELVAGEQSARPITPVVLANAINEVLDPEVVVLEEVTTNDAVVREHVSRERLHTIYAIGAAGLGWALGAAMGVKLAEPEREVVALCGDGSFVFSSPVAALWTARDTGSPFLTVIFNNHGYRAAKLPVTGLFPGGASVGHQDFSGTVIAGPPDYAAIARACGAHGEKVDDPTRLRAALLDAIGEVRAGRCAVVDVSIVTI